MSLCWFMAGAVPVGGTPIFFRGTSGIAGRLGSMISTALLRFF